MTVMNSCAGLRGGNWGTYGSPFFLSSSNSDSARPSFGLNCIGFRLASPASSPSSVPKISPNSIGLFWPSSWGYWVFLSIVGGM